MSAQVTTATMSGKVTAQDEPIIGATIVAVHEPSGTRYGTVTNVSGQFNLQGMRTGGPNKVETEKHGSHAVWSMYIVWESCLGIKKVQHWSMVLYMDYWKN